MHPLCSSVTLCLCVEKIFALQKSNRRYLLINQICFRGFIIYFCAHVQPQKDTRAGAPYR